MMETSMLDGPKVSVILPNYNHEKYLKQRLDSIFQQTFTDFEVIILDDCSTDNSRSVIDIYRSHPTVTHIEFNNQNSGSAFKQWKRGIDLAKGEWIWIAESDDYADPAFLERMILFLKNNNGRVGLLYCDSWIVIDGIVQAETFGMRKNNKLQTLHWSNDYINSGIDEIQNFLLAYGTINNTSAVLFNRSVLVKSNSFDLNLRFMGDKYAFVKMLALSDVGYVNIPLNYYRGLAHSKPKHTDDYLDYFYEQFLIFDWVSRNIKSIDKEWFFRALLLNAEISLVSGWRGKKIKTCIELLMTNWILFSKIMGHNLVRTLKQFSF
ncbi:MAG: glycosyltransferase family 2 protein [Cyclobacteriaceae bacterium]